MPDDESFRQNVQKWQNSAVNCDDERNLSPNELFTSHRRKQQCNLVIWT